ncbi:MAG: DUF3108 domain-containing protein [Hyphomicrobiaceae bacterium]
MYVKLMAAARKASCYARVASLVVTGVAVSGTTVAAGESWPRQVEATYRIAFNGFNIGTFAFRAHMDGATYSVESEARLSALLGVLKWHGASRSTGSLSGLKAIPSSYRFDFDGTGNTGSINMRFRHGDVTRVAVVPDKPDSADTVPLRSGHLKHVIDPLSAVLVMSHAPRGNVCARTIPIFDGKQRFDLSFSYVRQQAISEQRPSGQPAVATVCRVNYLPIAGHRMTKETQHMAKSTGIEVVMRPVPSAGVYVPYQITVPTVAGSATLTAEQVRIQTRFEQIALIH